MVVRLYGRAAGAFFIWRCKPENIQNRAYEVAIQRLLFFSGEAGRGALIDLAELEIGRFGVFVPDRKIFESLFEVIVRKQRAVIKIVF